MSGVRAAVTLALGITLGSVQAAPGSAAEPSAAPATPMPAYPPDVRMVLQGIQATGDARGQAFAIVDKHDARLWVFNAQGALVGSAPALLGSALGDESAPGVGRMVATGIPAPLRTTPAGRFESRPGRNDKGEAVVWVDHAAAVAIHRLRPAPAHERRPERLASETPADNRISLGCVVVSAAFYDGVVAPVLGRSRAVVYILPDSKRLQDSLGAIAGAAL